MPSEAHLLLLARAVLAELPPGWRARRCRRRWGADFGGSGHCWFPTKVISVPWPPTHVETIAVIAHEVAHALLHEHETRDHVREYEAESWAFRWMRSRGLRIPRDHVDGARWNVRAAIVADIKAGNKIRSSIRRWAYRKTREDVTC